MPAFFLIFIASFFKKVAPFDDTRSRKYLKFLYKLCFVGLKHLEKCEILELLVIAIGFEFLAIR